MTGWLSPDSISMSAMRGAGRDLSIVPEAGCSRPVRRPSRVDLPLPFGPMMPRREPSEMEKVTPSNRGVIVRIGEGQVRTRYLHMFLRVRRHDAGGM